MRTVRNIFHQHKACKIYLIHTGFQHRVCVAFCSCEPEAVTLVRHNMWPATPKSPTLAFHQDLLLWLESLVLEGCIGVDAFCRALDYKRGKCISSQVSELDKTSLIIVFKYYCLWLLAIHNCKVNLFCLVQKCISSNH